MVPFRCSLAFVVALAALLVSTVVCADPPRNESDPCRNKHSGDTCRAEDFEGQCRRRRCTRETDDGTRTFHCLVCESRHHHRHHDDEEEPHGRSHRRSRGEAPNGAPTPSDDAAVADDVIAGDVVAAPVAAAPPLRVTAPAATQPPRRRFACASTPTGAPCSRHALMGTIALFVCLQRRKWRHP